MMLNAIPIKMTSMFFTDDRQTNPKVHMEIQKTSCSQSNTEQKIQCRGTETDKKTSDAE
jgi:hypothetical protein